MKRQVIQNFLNLPGIAGVALMDSRTRPFFCGLDATLNSQQRDALAQGIQQVVDTTPIEFDAFSFRFSGRQAHIYKLTQGVILLVLTSDQLPFEDYVSALKQLRSTLEEDLANAVATFRLLAGCVTLSNQSYWSDGGAAKAPSIEVETPIPQPSARNQVVRYEEILAALNHLSDFTTQYLGKVIVANTWKSSRPDYPWLMIFELDRSGHFKLATPTPLPNQEGLTPEQHQWLKDWVQAFVERCSKIIRDFAKILTEKALDHHQQNLLLPQTS